MDADEVYDEVAKAIRRLEETQRGSERTLAELAAKVNGIVDLLVARGSMVDGHRRHLDVVSRSVEDGRPRVRLRPYIDKYTMETASPIDCEALIPLCHARCCTFQIELTTQDVEEGRLSWDMNQPYVLRQDAAGRCAHLDPATQLCGAYAYRPATCRAFDCRHDPRIWIDFDARIPAPVK